MCLAQGHNAVTQVIAVANSLDPDQAREKVFLLKLKLSRSSRSNDGKNGKVLKYDWNFLWSSTKP